MAEKNEQQNSTQQAHKPGVLRIDERFVSEGDMQGALNALESGAVITFGDMITAKAMTMPEVRAARTIQRFEGDHLDVNAEVDELRRLVSKANMGDMTTPEAMLVAQAHTLDALFCNLAMRSHSNMEAGYIEASDRYMRLALKAQAQAAKTIQILAELKNPRPVAFVKQANIATNQQVNNGPHAQAENFESAPIKQSGGSHELLENTRAPSLESRNDQALETLGALDRAAYCTRQG